MSARVTFRKVAASGVRRLILQPASATISVARAEGHYRLLSSRLLLAALSCALLVCTAVALTSLLLFVMYTPRIVDSALHSPALRTFLELGNTFVGRPRSHATLVCTVGAGLALRRAYPFDGVCDYIVFTHAVYNDRGAGSLRARGGQSWSWKFFLRQASAMTVTRLLPSFDWEVLVGALEPDLARRLNASLARERMHGLALFEVGIRPEQLPRVAAAMRLMAECNPGMFLALGVSFQGLHDGNALQLFPPGVLDKAVTPLSMLVLETHVPPQVDGQCRTALTSIPEPRSQDPEDQQQQLSLKGADRILALHPELKHVVGSGLIGCFSLFIGALVFNTSGQDGQLGAVCTSWFMEKLEKVRTASTPLRQKFRKWTSDARS
ncbi:hypothetical protein V5799_022148 [Amblyomma americanum]|uniref:Uncharacterized protein n=1 Tax=Amblyomma americanum TaxID=6943 RepID=A0AAQ4FMX4_AMBAM